MSAHRCCYPSCSLDGTHHSPAETLPGCPLCSPTFTYLGVGGTSVSPDSPPITPLSDHTKQPVSP